MIPEILLAIRRSIGGMAMRHRPGTLPFAFMSLLRSLATPAKIPNPAPNLISSEECIPLNANSLELRRQTSSFTALRREKPNAFVGCVALPSCVGKMPILFVYTKLA